MLSDKLPMRAALRDALRATRRGPVPAPVPGRLFDTVYVPRPPDPSQPPTLFVVVDTEAEFDWRKPFSRDLIRYPPWTTSSAGRRSSTHTLATDLWW